MKPFLYTVIFFAVCLFVINEGFSQVVLTSNDTCTPDEYMNSLVCNDEDEICPSCWDQTGTCTTTTTPLVREKDIPVYVRPLFVEGDTVIIKQYSYEMIPEEPEDPDIGEQPNEPIDPNEPEDPNGSEGPEGGENTEGNEEDPVDPPVPITVYYQDSAFNAQKEYIPMAIGDMAILEAGFFVILEDGIEHRVHPVYVAPDPIYEIGNDECEVTLVINDTISAGNLHLRKNVTIKVVSGGSLNIDNLTQEREITAKIVVDGGDLKISGNLTPEAARSTNNNNIREKTTLNIEVINDGTFVVQGKIDLKNNVHLNIDGDGNSKVVTGELDIANEVEVNIKKLGGLEVLGDTHYQGTTSAINVEGHFETKSLKVTGGGETQFNAIGNATVKIHEDVHIGGDSQVTLGGDSVVEIGGDVTVTGTSSGLNITNSNDTTIKGDFNISGGATVNLQDQSSVNVDGNVEIHGNSSMNASDEATLVVKGGCDFDDEDCPGGLFVDGNSKFNVSDKAGAYICGNKPEVNTDGDGDGVDVSLYCGGLSEGDESACATYTGCMILPVVFSELGVDFNNTERIVTVTWSTAKEWENSHFEIERSYGGIDNFIHVGEITGRGWTDEISEYNFQDDDMPLAGGNLYYRVKQVDFNGQYEYSEIVAVRLPTVQFSKGVWRAYPNPVMGNTLNIDLMDMTKYNNEKVTLRVMSSTSNYGDMEFQDLYELNETVSHFFTNIPNGLYILEIKWGISVERIKVMKQ